MPPPPEADSDDELLANTEKSFSNDLPPQWGQTIFSLFLCSISKLFSHLLHLYSYNGIAVFPPNNSTKITNNQYNVKVIAVFA
jgi:hypothetical protein